MSNKSFGLVIFCFVLSFIYLLVCREGISKSVAHHHRMQAVDKIAELDDVIASYDSDCVRPAGDDDDDNDDDDDDDVGRIQHPVLPDRVSGRASGGL